MSEQRQKTTARPPRILRALLSPLLTIIRTPSVLCLPAIITATIFFLFLISRAGASFLENAASPRDAQIGVLVQFAPLLPVTFLAVLFFLTAMIPMKLRWAADESSFSDVCEAICHYLWESLFLFGAAAIRSLPLLLTGFAAAYGATYVPIPESPFEVQFLGAMLACGAVLLALILGVVRNFLTPFLVVHTGSNFGQASTAALHVVRDQAGALFALIAIGTGTAATACFSIVAADFTLLDDPKLLFLSLLTAAALCAWCTIASIYTLAVDAHEALSLAHLHGLLRSREHLRQTTEVLIVETPLLDHALLAGEAAALGRELFIPAARHDRKRTSAITNEERQEMLLIH